MKTARQYITEALIKFGRLFQLPEPQAEYVDAIHNALHAKKWKLSTFMDVLNSMTTDQNYAETARFGKYPTIYDYLRIEKQRKSANFYQVLTSYLGGNWWEKEIVLELATEQQINAITMAGGLENLYNRATSDTPTPVYKIVDIVAQNETESPEQLIDTSHRIGQTTPIAQIMAQK